MEKHSRPEADTVVKFSTIYNEESGVDVQKDFHQSKEITQLIEDIQKNNKILHEVYPPTKWFTDLMESVAIAVKYDIEHVLSVDMIVACTYDVVKNYAYIGRVLIDPNILYHNSFESIILKMVKGT